MKDVAFLCAVIAGIGGVVTAVIRWHDSVPPLPWWLLVASLMCGILSMQPDRYRYCVAELAVRADTLAYLRQNPECVKRIMETDK